jgi:hypothetical protein
MTRVHSGLSFEMQQQIFFGSSVSAGLETRKKKKVVAMYYKDLKIINKIKL